MCTPEVPCAFFYGFLWMNSAYPDNVVLFSSLVSSSLCHFCVIFLIIDFNKHCWQPLNFHAFILFSFLSLYPFYYLLLTPSHLSIVFRNGWPSISTSLLIWSIFGVTSISKIVWESSDFNIITKIIALIYWAFTICSAVSQELYIHINLHHNPMS